MFGLRCIIIATTLLHCFTMPAVANRLESLKSLSRTYDLSRIDLPSSQGGLLALSAGEVNNSQGAYTYAYPIPEIKWRPIAPKLQISYSSYSANALLGQGFQLTGISSIQRSLHQGVPDQNTPLESTIDGLLVTSQEGLRPRLDSSFNKYLPQDDGSILMLSQSGIRYHFGLTDASKESRLDYTYKYHISKVEDIFGNHVVFSYHKDHGLSYPTKIQYINKDNTPVWQYSFSYEDRPDAWESYRAGFASALYSAFNSYNWALATR